MAAATMSPAPLERSLSKMMMKSDAEEVDLYADYKLKQREHEFLKIQVRRSGRGCPRPRRSAPLPRKKHGRSRIFDCRARGTVGAGLRGHIPLRRAGGRLSPTRAAQHAPVRLPVQSARNLLTGPGPRRLLFVCATRSDRVHQG